MFPRGPPDNPALMVRAHLVLPNWVWQHREILGTHAFLPKSIPEGQSQALCRPPRFTEGTAQAWCQVLLLGCGLISQGTTRVLHPNQPVLGRGCAALCNHDPPPGGSSNGWGSHPGPSWRRQCRCHQLGPGPVFGPPVSVFHTKTPVSRGPERLNILPKYIQRQTRPLPHLTQLCHSPACGLTRWLSKEVT